MKTLLFLFLLIMTFTICAQKPQIRHIDSMLQVQKLDSLKLAFPFVTNVPSEYELAIYLALEYYPELKNNRIHFKLQKIGTTLNARPTLASLLFKKRSKRVYVVRINNLIDAEEIITLDDVSFNSKVGVLGHEFNHFLDYSKRGILQMFGRGVDYLSSARKAKFEKQIDTETIKRGLGWQCYDWSCFMFYQSHATADYLTFTSETYLVPQEILAIMTEK